jgi:hypothetical protein
MIYLEIDDTVNQVQIGDTIYYLDFDVDSKVNVKLTDLRNDINAGKYPELDEQFSLLFNTIFLDAPYGSIKKAVKGNMVSLSKILVSSIDAYRELLSVTKSIRV